MATCEMCGKEKELVNAVVEGSMLKVCSDCGKHGNVISISRPKTVIRTFESKEEDVEVIVEDYFYLVKTAREKKGLTQEELAKDIGEKESLIHQVESQKMKPTFKLAKKLNVYLGINLIEKVPRMNVNESKEINFKDKDLTIGDLLKRKN